MANEYVRTREFRDASFRYADLTGATFRACGLNGVRIIGSEVDDLHIEAHAGELGSVTVEGIDVTGYVTAELDRRFPERAEIREARTVEALRTALDRMGELWGQTRAHAQQLPEQVRAERVNGEWSFLETLRHLILAVDVWMGRVLPEVPEPFSPIGLPPGEHPDEDLDQLGIDRHAAPSYAEVSALFDEQLARTRRSLDATRDDDLERVRTAVAMPAWGEESHSVRTCFWVVLNELCEHRRYAERDLAVLLRREHPDDQQQHADDHRTP
jgi:uncharacterized damage-inducible protein DinB